MFICSSELSNLFVLWFKQGTDGRSLLALKFMEIVVLLYTPDPHGPSEPPPDQNCEGTLGLLDCTFAEVLFLER